MEKMKYDLKTLSETFMTHHKKSIERNREILENYIKSYPGEEVPQHLREDFSLPKALSSICDEIRKIQDRMG